MENIDHDQIFKTLLSTFFLEFVDLFLPDIADQIDKGYGYNEVSTELFTDAVDGEKKLADILMKVKLLGVDKDAYFLIHVEHQSSPHRDFPERMFDYYYHLNHIILMPKVAEK